MILECCYENGVLLHNPSRIKTALRDQLGCGLRDTVIQRAVYLKANTGPSLGTRSCNRSGGERGSESTY